MKLVVDIPEGTLEQVREIVQSEDYDDPAEFVNIALENQIALERTGGSGETIQTLDEYFADDVDLTNGQQDGSGSQLDNGDYTHLTPVDPPDKDRIETGPLWGQYNRIFPVKIVVRQLANTLAERQVETMAFKQFQNNVANTARDIGLRLKDIDSDRGRGRGEKLSSGLPVGDEPAKSIGRFKEQFVGRIDQKNNLGGACPALRFVNITPDNEIGLTEWGIEFAMMDNPLLDDTLHADSALSDEEREFYLSHVADHLPAEYEAIQTVAASIQSGYDRPDPLTDQVAKLNGGWTNAQASTMRTGLVSRMYELGLVTRERVGQRGVAYRLTDRAKSHRIMEGTA